jgi:uncharacterized membrane protein YphA (DoxX/SURF4 family)
MVGRESMGNSRILMTFGPPILRIVLGTLFITNGWQKLFNLSQTQGYFQLDWVTCRVGPIDWSSRGFRRLIPNTWTID